ncbi:MAG: enoyl-CoA hydratase/isomerase family protein [Candidatus Rokubacteria bacterium]|nr:enoyl-CoA hydratase/isomerase family protein [Candidatus Rokubacteria bacterium]
MALAWAPGAALVTFDRPDALNAVDARALTDLETVVARLEADDETAVVVLTGAGRAFVGGGDIAHMAALTPDEGERFVHRGQAVLRRLERLPQITVAAINGFALGGGLEIALACDLRVAAESAELGLPEVTVGLIPGWGGTQRLVRLAGRGVAKDLVFTGRRLAAREALELGVVNRVVHDDALLETCRELAARIRRASPIAVRQAKKAIDEGAELSLDQGLVLEAEAWLVNFCAPDRVEGLRAFVEKRRPVYRGRHAAKG